MRPLACVALAIAGAVLGSARPAHADTDNQVRLATWATAAAETSGAAYYALRFHYSKKPIEGFETPIPLVFAGGALLAAYHWDLDARPATATHGAVWAGADLFLVGMMIDARDDRTGLKIGPTAIVFGAAGAIAGGALGATSGGRWPAIWLGAPMAGMAVGALGGGIAALALGDIGGDRTLFRISVGTAVGVTAGIVFAAIAGFGHDTTTTAATPRATGAIGPGPHPMVFSFGGAF